MVATLLSICQDAADEMRITRPTTLIGATDQNSRTLLALANRTGIELAKEGEWTNLIRVHEFDTVADQAEYDLPEDFDRLIVETVWDRGQLMPVDGPLTPQEWQAIKSGLIGAGIYFSRYRIVRESIGINRKYVLDPTPTDINTNVYEYISSHWCANADGTETYAKFQADTDQVLLPDSLFVLAIIWRFLRATGLEWQTQFQEYQEALTDELGSNRPSPTLSLVGGQRWLPQLLTPFNSPDTGIGGTS